MIEKFVTFVKPNSIRKYGTAKEVVGTLEQEVALMNQLRLQITTGLKTVISTVSTSYICYETYLPQ